MPTGIEEFLGAVVSLVVEAIAASPFSGGSDPNGAAEAGDAAQAGPAPLLSPELLEGQGGTCAVDAPSPPVNGDRAPPTLPERSTPDDYRTPSRVVEMDPAIVEASPPPAASVPPPAPGAAPSTDGLPFTPMVPNYSPPLWSEAPPAGEREIGPAFDPPGAPPPDSFPLSVPADYADAWQRNVTAAPGKLLFNRTGEELSQDIKAGVEEGLDDLLFDPDDSEAERIAKVALAATIKTATDVAADMTIVPVLDPGFAIRGIMRTGAASAEGIEDINQGRTVEGGVKVVGEVSGIVLTVLTPVRAFKAKGPTPMPGEPSITVYLEKGGVGKEKVVGGHNKVVLEMGDGQRKVTDVTHTASDITFQPDGSVTGGEVVAKARSFGTQTEAMKSPGVISYTRRLTPAEAARVSAAIDRALAQRYGGVEGGLGPFSVLGENCSTYAAAMARAGGVAVSGRFGPHVTYLMFKYLSPLGATVVGAGMAEAAAVNSFYGQPAASQ